MSPEAGPTQVFGRTAAQSARGAVLLGVIGAAFVWVLTRLLTAPSGLLGRAYASTGLPDWLPLAVGFAAVGLLAFSGCLKSIQEAHRFEVSPGGLQVSGPMGAYRTAWDNVTAAEVTGGGALGLKLVSRDALLETHQGTGQQREWLRTLEPYGEWDLLFPAADLGVAAAEVLEAIQPYLVGGGERTSG